MKLEAITKSDHETIILSEKLGRHAKAGDVFAVTGDLGAGKTVFAKGIARGLGIHDEITSPTFTLLEIYEGPIIFYHFDLYRIENKNEFYNLNFEEYWESNGVSVVEWADKAEGLLPLNSILVNIEYLSDNERRITVEYPSA
jgi:tRNA threonylcarbamoyladenosine biosynthesis protein TsaE